MPSYFIKTFGCQSNKSDSERIAGDYEARGFVEAEDWKNCDELVVNTCAVRQSAEHRARGFLQNVVVYFDNVDGRIDKLNGDNSETLKQVQDDERIVKDQHDVNDDRFEIADQVRNDDKEVQGDKIRLRPKIILTGCMSHHGEQKLLKMMPMVDEVLPINEVGFNSAVVRKDKKHAWIPISTGCNSFCTYCIVPYSRGREQSRDFQDIMTEVKELVDQGYSEITLLGMNVNSWGLEKLGIGFRKLMMEKKSFTREDLPENQSQYLTPSGTPPFVKLLQAISAFDQIKKIRFLTSNPWDFHDELVEEVGKNKKIDRYVHLPVQSGSNGVLYRMNRGYTRESYIELVEKLRATDPEIVIGTDIVVGFAGETEAEFQETVDLAERMDWHVGFVAMYSPRPGTAAWRIYPDDIPHTEKKRRWEILDQIINKDNLKKRPRVV